MIVKLFDSVTLFFSHEKRFYDPGWAPGWSGVQFLRGVSCEVGIGLWSLLLRVKELGKRFRRRCQAARDNTRYELFGKKRLP